MMLIGDFGTSYTKILDVSKAGARPEILPTKDIPKKLHVGLATGHNGKRYADRYVNELIALARGSEALVKDTDFVVLDCGSRDIKFIKYQAGILQDMGWNAECGAAMGFSIELLERYYELDFKTLAVPERTFSITCGVLGMSDIFDAVVSGVDVGEAVARFVKGIAVNAFRFCGSPQKIYLSGGLCDNPLFVHSFPCEVVPLGRFLLLEGLRAHIKKHA